MGFKSMTGFGEGRASAHGVRVAVELSSVNRKQLDVNVTLPRNLITLDAQVQELVRAEFSRGRVSGIVRMESAASSAGSVKVNRKLAAEYVDSIRAAAKKLGMEDNLGADTLLRIPGLVALEQDDLDANHVADVLGKAVAKALSGLSRMRAAEGRALEKDLRVRLAALEEMMKAIRTVAPGVVRSYREKLFQRLEKAGVADLAGDERIVREIALFADRCDIAEELTRLKSHIGQIRKLLHSAEPVGRTLDFLCQEMFREINTIGSKANELAITRQVVAFKTELERIREQVQNVE
ncbi:MAG: YicC family protein [Kiritimatiellales bacterium]|nr:YicC family protein [Kiritimatiellales bacterium]